MADVPPGDLLAYWLGIRGIDVAAGLAGGLVRGLVNPAYTWTMRLSSTVVGSITAGYLNPPVSRLASQWFSTWAGSPEEVTGAVGFLLGLCGMTVAEMLLRWARHWRDKAPPPALPR